MKKLTLLGVGAVGYVLGAKAGRERYEQISRQAQKLRNNPQVQQKVDDAKHAARDAADTAAQKAKEQRSDSGGSPTPDFGGSPTTGGTNSFGRGDEGL